MESKNKILEMKNIVMRYHTVNGETLAVNDFNLDIFKGEFLSIVGPSGCGKSTILSLISGLMSPSGGKIFFDQNKSPSQIVGYMLQRDYLLSWRTIKQNILLGLEIKKNLNEKSKDYALSLLERYNLGKFKDYYPNQLSGGMRQKVALIRTLVVKPDLLLLDEPFSALDYQTRLNLSQEVRNIIKTEKKTAVLVTHDISEAASLSDRVAVLSSRPSKIKKIIEIDEDFRNLSADKKRRSKKFNDYFDVIWSELNEKRN